MLGAVIGGRFVVERRVAEGGMGIIYRGRDLHTEAPVGIKVMRGPHGDDAERFLREARLLSEVRHPGIVRYLTHGRTAEGDLFLAMEWLEGEDLASRLAAGELTFGESLQLLSQVAAALAVAHARRIVHRDIKPANLFLVDDRVDRVKVLDFGVARASHLSTMTRTGAVIGTPRFMAPEQARGLREIDARADVFALGVVLFRCLTGQHPHAGESPQEIFARLLHEDAPRLRELRPDLPRELEDLLARMLAREPAARPPDAGAVLAEAFAFDLTVASGGRPRPAPEITVAERRIQCVLVMPLAEPDERARAIAATHGGTLETGPDTVITIGGQMVASDQARLAARCAVALSAHLPRVPMALVMGRRETGDRSTTSAATERARAVLAAAPDTPAIHIDWAIAGLLGTEFDVVGDGVGLRLRQRDGDEDTRVLLGKATPFVGRDQELAQLEAIFDGVAGEPEARAVLVSAPAGQGKSRLRAELTRRLRRRSEGVELWLGRGDPVRAGAPFGLLGDAIRGAAGIQGDEPPAEQQRLLAERVGRHLRGERAARVAELIGEIAGVPFPAEESVQLRAARRDPALLADKLRGAWSEWLGAECAHQPVILVLEDLHWGDLPTVKLVDHALQALAERPFLVLALSRPEVNDLFPRLWEARGLSQINLGGLPRRAAERLIRQALGEVDGAAVAAMIDRGGGNPFFLEELIRHVAQHGAGAFPESVLAMVTARFEALGAEARRALRAASIFGEVFWRGGVATLLGSPVAVDAALAELTDRELCERRSEPRLAGEEEYAFRHGLLREAAYALLTDADRARGHQLAGDWLESAGEREGLVIAEHLERGGEAGRAASWFARAAQQALDGSDLAAAIARAERGALCGATGDTLGRLRLLQTVARRLQGDLEGTFASGSEAMGLLARGSEPWFLAAAEAAVASAIRSAVDPQIADAVLAETAGAVLTAAAAIALARIALQCGLGRGPGELYQRAAARLAALPGSITADPGVRAHVEQALMHRLPFEADPEARYDSMQRVERAFREVGDERQACQLVVHLGTLDGMLGRLESALRLYLDCADEATRVGMPFVGRWARELAVTTLLDLGRTGEALSLADAVVAEGVPIHSPRFIAASSTFLCRVYLARGDLDEAERALRTGVAPGEMAAPIVHIARAYLARLLAGRGRTDEALAVVAMLPAELAGEFYLFTAELHRARIETSRAAGRLEETARHVAAARAWVERVAAPLSRETRATFSRHNAAIAAILAA